MVGLIRSMAVVFVVAIVRPINKRETPGPILFKTVGVLFSRKGAM